MTTTSQTIAHDQASPYRLATSLLTGALLSHCLVAGAWDERTQRWFEQRKPQVELMPELTGQWVASRMVMNTVPASIRMFHGPVPVDEVLAWYRNRWQGQRSITHRNGDWYILATKRDDGFVSIHVRANGRGVQGVMVVSGDPDRFDGQTESRFPYPSSSRIVSRQAFDDDGRKAETITLHSRRPANIEKTAIEIELLNNGWQRVVERRSETLQQAYTMEFRQGKQSARVFVSADPQWDNETMTLITWTKN